MKIEQTNLVKGLYSNRKKNLIILFLMGDIARCSNAKENRRTLLGIIL